MNPKPLKPVRKMGKKRAVLLLHTLRKIRVSPKTELTYETPFQLLVAVMLSARATDRSVNLATPALFRAFKDAKSMSLQKKEDLYPYLKTIGLYQTKAARLVQTAAILQKDYQGDVPNDDEALLKLPGVGQKTAHVVRNVLFSAPLVPVDTHVFRVSHRMGLSKSKTPKGVETDLTLLYEEKERIDLHHQLLLHGRHVCKARNPLCKACEVRLLCPRPLD